MARKKTYQKRNKQKLEEDIFEKKPRKSIASDVKRSAAAIILFALAILMILGFFGSAGVSGAFLDKAAGLTVGWGKLIFPIFLVIAGIVLLLKKVTSFYVIKIASLSVIFLSFTGLFHWFYDPGKMAAAAKIGKGGGYIGYAITHILEKFLGSAGSLVVILTLLLVGTVVSFNFSIMHFISRLRKEEADEKSESAELKPAENKEEKPEFPENISTEEKDLKEIPSKEDAEAEKNIGRIEFVDGPDQFVSPEINVSQALEGSEFVSNKALTGRFSDLERGSGSMQKRKNKKWNLPSVDMLEESYGSPNGGDIDKNFEIIEKTLKNFGIIVERGKAKIGPSVTQYSIRPAVGVKISKILALQSDLSLALANTIRIEAPIPGQSLIGIEVPNKSPLTVRLRNLLEDVRFKRRESNLILPLGENVSGNNILDDLGKMPHLMIAGATGTGKSVCVNSIILSLLFQNTPDDMRFIMVDPKRVELSLYNGIPHLLTDVIVENSKVINTFKWAVGEMERRYRLLQDTGSRDIASYRRKSSMGETIKRTDPETGEVTREELKNLPYIVIVIDELADLMGSHGKEVEGAIVRIAQMARAVGIHLIISTQRPSVEVITGLIKANITTRIAFQVATQIDSRTIIDMGGAEKLIGNGDMLLLSAKSSKPMRVQGALVSESEVRRVVEFLRKQKKNKENSDAQEDITENKQKEILEFKGADTASDDDDDMLKQAKVEIMRAKKASASFLQRRLRIGYARAARMLDMLEEKGVVGPADGAKPREVYGVTDDTAPSYQDSLEDQEKRDKWNL